ncbi:hypothetical protein OG417_45195 [Actinoallomurus sp. NBC_01490]|uniref:hypothetical protein n=1 Tax=Actinoallomurus sp. NBC_01490 TaxID=2903557 RepID=UPI002E2EF51F|nr:hypothetical protein [Actinoallomurus sp. NBC_01490]
MLSSAAPLPIEHVTAELKRLRRGPGLAHPMTATRLSPQLRRLLAGDSPDDPHDSAGEVVRIITALRRAIDNLAPPERLYAQVDFNLSPDHGHKTLTERHESLARHLKCAAKTVQRHADKALETIALTLVTGEDSLGPVDSPRFVADIDHAASWQERLRRFWRLSPTTGVDIVCSEIPEDERPYFASPADRNYLRYAKFADLDSLIFVKTHLIKIAPDVTVRDFSPSEYYDTDAERLIVIGGPPWNAKYREFLPQLPYYFEPHPLGEDDPIVLPQLDVAIAPRWTAQQELLQDLAVFTRLTLAQGTTVFLLGGCLTLGVLGAAKCFLQGAQGARNAARIDELVGDRDFALITETRRIGGITDTADLTTRNPLVLLARDENGFSVLIDNTKRYLDP